MILFLRKIVYAKAVADIRYSYAYILTTSTFNYFFIVSLYGIGVYKMNDAFILFFIF